MSHVVQCANPHQIRTVLVAVGFSLALGGCAGPQQRQAAPLTIESPAPESSEMAEIPASIDPALAEAGDRLVLAARYGQTDVVGLLLERGTDINFSDAYGNTPLIAASGNGHRAIVAQLLEQGAQVNASNKEENSALMVAAAGGHYELVNDLIAAGAQVNHLNNHGESALFMAVQYGHYRAAKVLLNDGANPNLSNSIAANKQNGGFTPLMYAAVHGLTTAQVDWPAMVELLLQNGADPNLENIHGESALIFARRNNDRQTLSLLKLAGARDNQAYVRLAPNDVLLKAARLGDAHKVQEVLAAGSADANYVAQNGVTPLLAAAFEGHLPIVKLLYEYGSEVNFVPSGLRQFALSKSHAPLSERDLMRAASRGDTALLAAGRQGHLDVVTYLLGQGAVIDLANRQGETPLIVAARTGRLSLVEMMLARGADADTLARDMRDSRSERLPSLALGRDNVLIMAAQGGHFAVVKALLAAGAKVDHRGKAGKTALYHAAQGGYFDIVTELLGTGADTGVATFGGTTPLMIAAREGRAKVVSALINKDAPVNTLEQPELGYEAQSNVNGMTALMYAAREGYSDIVEMLLLSGAMVKLHNNSDMTALDEARSHGHDKVVRLLEPRSDEAAVVEVFQVTN